MPTSVRRINYVIMQEHVAANVSKTFQGLTDWEKGLISYCKLDNRLCNVLSSPSRTRCVNEYPIPFPLSWKQSFPRFKTKPILWRTYLLQLIEGKSWINTLWTQVTLHIIIYFMYAWNQVILHTSLWVDKSKRWNATSKRRNGKTANEDKQMWSVMSGTRKTTSRRGRWIELRRWRDEFTERWVDFLKRRVELDESNSENNDSTRSIGVRKRWNAITKRRVEHFVHDLPSYKWPTPPVLKNFSTAIAFSCSLWRCK